MLPQNITDLAKFLGLTEKAVRDLAVAAPKLYRTKPEPKKNGGVRMINKPFNHLKIVQRKILHSVLNQIPIHSALHGGPETSVKSAAKIHTKQPVVITLDIQDFFPGIKSTTVRRLLEGKGFAQEVAILLTRLLTHKGRLPQGAPTSPAIARLALGDVCNQIELLLKSINHYAKMTIYVDDITISGPLGLERLVPTICSIFERNGFTVNPKKKKIMTQKEEQIVLGIRVNQGLQPSAEFEATIKAEREIRHPKDPKLRGLESYRHFIARP